MLLPELHSVLDADTGGGLAGTRCPREGICIERNSTRLQPFFSASQSPTLLWICAEDLHCVKKRGSKRDRARSLEEHHRSVGPLKREDH